jgi:aminopeptidase N
MLRHWIPSHDVPYDKATLDLFITVPNDLDAFSNGLLLSTSAQAETKTFHWQETNPIATYLIAIAVGNYVTLEKDYQSIAGHNIPLEFYAFPSSVDAVQIDWQNLPTMMDFFERNFTPYPFDRYATAQCYNRGAMEHQQMTTYSTQLITGDNRYDYIMAHELAHHWWGDLVTLGDWRDIWLNEGFATYSEALYFESLYGQDYLAEYMDALQSIYLGEVSRRGHFPIYDPDYKWGGTIYQKGAWVLHMLRWTIGDDAFWRTLHTWADRYAYGNALIPDFIQIAEEESGQDLAWFFDQWIYKAGYPDFDISWNYQKNSQNDYTVTVDVKQQQWNQFQFTAPFEIAIETVDGSVLDTLESSSFQQSFQIDVNSEPLAIHIDPNNWLLKQFDIISDPSLPGVKPNEFYLSQNYPNPFLQNGQTEIVYQIPQIFGPHPTSIKIYNILGRHVATLIDRPLQGGLYKTTWDGKDMSGRTVASGVYFYRLESLNQFIEKKLVIFEN